METPSFTLTLPNPLSKRRHFTSKFDDVLSLERYLRIQMKYWDDILGFTLHRQPGKRIALKSIKSLNSAFNFLKRPLSHDNHVMITPVIERWLSDVPFFKNTKAGTLYESFQKMDVESEAGSNYSSDFLALVADDIPDLSEASIATLSQHPEIRKSPLHERLIAITEGRNHTPPINGSIDHNENFEQNIQALLESGRQRINNLLEDQSKSFDARVQTFETQAMKTIKDLDKSRLEIASATEKSNTLIEDNVNAVREKVKLDETKTYWNTKAKTHSDRRDLLMKILIGYAAAISIAIIVAFCVTFNTETNAFGTLGDVRSLLIAGFYVMFTTILFWGGRILTRIYLGNVHLTNDAAERAVLIETYLALNADGGISPEERELMLRTVFRPSTDGVVRDDAAPFLSPQAILSALGK